MPATKRTSELLTRLSAGRLLRKAPSTMNYGNNQAVSFCRFFVSYPLTKSELLTPAWKISVTCHRRRHMSRVGRVDSPCQRVWRVQPPSWWWRWWWAAAIRAHGRFVTLLACSSVRALNSGYGIQSGKSRQCDEKEERCFRCASDVFTDKCFQIGTSSAKMLMS